jgi:hypothetical protein
VGWLGDWTEISGPPSADRQDQLLQLYDSDGFTALHFAVWNMHAKAISTLLTICPTLALICNKHGWSPLHLASWNNDRKTIHTLLESGSSVRHADRRGWTALHWAASGGSGEAVALLLRHRADIGSKTKGGETALHIAAIGRRFNVFKLLLKSGIDVSIKDGEGMTAMDIIKHCTERWTRAASEALPQLRAAAKVGTSDTGRFSPRNQDPSPLDWSLFELSYPVSPAAAPEMKDPAELVSILEIPSPKAVETPQDSPQEQSS